MLGGRRVILAVGARHDVGQAKTFDTRGQRDQPSPVNALLDCADVIEDAECPVNLLVGAGEDDEDGEDEDDRDDVAETVNM